MQTLQLLSLFVYQQLQNHLKETSTMFYVDDQSVLLMINVVS